ncbi:MAG: hypothetical protein IJ068_06480 [Bacilli bacterium]|nr:hypothetical protein [Bacilli bacterium]
MLISNVICETSSFLRIIYFIELARKLLFIVLPIGLIIMLTIKAYKNIINANSELKLEVISSVQKIIAVIIIIFVPIFVDIIMNFTGYDTRDAYQTCRENATIERIEYFSEIEDKVREVEDLIDSVKSMPTVENLEKAEKAVSSLYGVANGSIIEDLEYKLASIRTKITMTDAEFYCKVGGGVYTDSHCTYPSPSIGSSGSGATSSNGMVYYTYNTTNDYLVVNTKLKVADYVKYIQSNKICQTQSKSFRYGDQCLCFAEEHTHALMTGDTHKTAAQINDSYYSGYFNKYSDDDKTKILNMVYSELVSNKPIILHVNGNKAGTSRHYVTVIGFKSTVTSAANLKETDLLLIDSDDAKVEQLHTWGTSRFMTTGAKCKKKDYTGYQVYMVK